MSAESSRTAPRRETPHEREERAGDGADGRAEEDQELIMHLERDQLVASTLRPVPPAHLGSRAVLGLWALRIFAVLVSAMVIYTFIARLG